MEVKTKRTAREIKVDSKLINNTNINVKIGTVENRECPETIYIFISFWAKPIKGLLNKNQDVLKDILNKRFSNIYINELRDKIRNSKYFINEKENIYIKNIPENINYNKKRNFISLEFYLHTININKEKKFPISNKKNTEIFDEAVSIANIVGNSEFLLKQEEFEIFKKSM